MKQQRAWIHCRVLAESSRNLLNYQEEVLSNLADDNNLKIVGVTKSISSGKNFNSFDMQKLITHIKRHDIDIILVTSRKRISIYDDLYEEFEMLCKMHDVLIISHTIDDLLSEIENEALFNYLSTIDKETLTIILLKIFGYSTHEISEILSLSHSSIYKKIHRLRKKLKKF